MKKIIMVFTLVIVMAGTAEALNEFYGNQMVKICFGRNGTTLSDRMLSSTYCNGYIDGVLNRSAILLNGLGTEATFCIPNNITDLQIENIIKNHLDNNPRLLHQPATFLITVAMEKAFPCPAK